MDQSKYNFLAFSPNLFSKNTFILFFFAACVINFSQKKFQRNIATLTVRHGRRLHENTWTGTEAEAKSILWQSNIFSIHRNQFIVAFSL